MRFYLNTSKRFGVESDLWQDKVSSFHNATMVTACSSIIATLALIVTCVPKVVALLNATETTIDFVLANDRLYTAINKTSGAIYKLALDDQDLLGGYDYVPNTPGGSSGNGVYGVGPYLGEFDVFILMIQQ